MSTSLNVVSIAAVRCASTRLRAIVSRRLLMRTRSSARVPAGRGAGATAGFDGAAPRAGLVAAGAAGSACGRRRQSLDNVPLGDTTGIARAGHRRQRHIVRFGDAAGGRRRPLFARRNGARRRRRVRRRCRRAGRRLRHGRGLRRRCGRHRAADRRRRATSPTLTSSPSWRAIFASTPACSAPTSRSIFSVSSSTTGSPAATASPSCLSHRAMRRFDDRFAELGHDDVDRQRLLRGRLSDGGLRATGYRLPAIANVRVDLRNLSVAILHCSSICPIRLDLVRSIRGSARA